MTDGCRTFSAAGVLPCCSNTPTPGIRCFHCGAAAEPDNARRIVFDGASHSVCSSACQTVACTIINSGLDDYYRRRQGAANTPVADPSNHSTAIYNEPEVQSQYTVSTSGGTTVLLAISGLHCGACVGLLENSLGRINGIRRVSVNLTNARMEVAYDPQSTSLRAIIDSVQSIGYKAEPYEPNHIATTRRQQQVVRLKQLTLAGLVAMQSMMFALPGYLSGDGGIEQHHTLLFQWAAMLLTVPVLLYSAQPFWSGAWRSIRSRRPGMDVPVAIALLCASAASLHAMYHGSGEVYFDSIAMFIFLLLGARYLEWSIRQRSADALEALDASIPQTAHLLAVNSTDAATGYIEDLLSVATATVPAVRLKAGDLFRAHSGERIAADAKVVAGNSTIDCSLLSGESLPVAAAAGALIPGGAINGESPLVLRVTRPLASSALSTITHLVNRGASEKPPLIRRTDWIATVFVSALLVVAVLTWLLWLTIEPARALPVAIAVLIVSCPCALSLATPATLAAATAGLLRQRILVTHGHTLETLNRISDVVFDKTGTLTTGSATLEDIHCASGISRDQALQFAASLEHGSSHPFATALLNASRQVTGSRTGKYAEYRFETVEHVLGAGACATVCGQPMLQFRIGTARWCGVTDPHAWRSTVTACMSEVFLVAVTASAATPSLTQAIPPQDSVEVLARFSFDDTLKPGAIDLVQFFNQRGVRVHLLSGDRHPAVTRVGRALGLAAQRITCQATPQDKQALVGRMQKQSKTVLMIGDGINDAPVLASADVSIAVTQASTLACVAADAVVLSEDVKDIESLVLNAQRTNRIIVQNLYWAAGYNLVAIPMAAAGMVPPWLAAVGMSLSSLLVAGNALRAATPR